MKKLIMFLSIVALSLMIITPAIAGDTTATSDVGVDVMIQDNRQYEGSISQGTKMKRYFAPAGEINYPGMPGRFDAAPERSGYMNSLNVQAITEYDDDGLTTQEAMNMAKGVGGKRVLVRAKYGKVDKDARMALDAPISVVYKKADGMKSLGIITIVSDSKKAISPDVFAEAQVKAWELGGTMLHVKVQGFQREVHTSGKGIGFSWTGTTISGGQTSATTGVMGFGASWGQAGYYDHPFIIIHVLAKK